jgi:hypothetical protein
MTNSVVSVHPNEQVVRKSYEAFHARSAAIMNASYDPVVVFEDPAFGRLEGQQVFSMWQMLCSRAKELQVSVSNIRADNKTGSAHWQAKYLFGPSRRPVHNVVQANFIFRDGKIIEHVDTFSLWKWSSMAIGLTGTILGWRPLFKSAIQKSVRRQLDIFMQSSSV